MHAAAIDLSPQSLPPLSLYVHLPWCVKKCPYCDFNSHAVSGAVPVDEYLAALMADLARDAPLAEGRPIETVFIGGGTPSLFSPDAIARLMDGIAAQLTLTPEAEITLEANPGAIERGRFADYRRAGVNRVSLGVQSFDPAMLGRLGRIHSAQDARAAVREAQDAGLDNLNLDLMYALPEQTLAGALTDLEAALALAPAHVSHYQLTLEPNTEFAAHPPPLPDSDHAWEMQERCQERLAAAGYAQYEVSAYARPGRRCRHNLAYWRFADYLGIGAGAHGKLTGAAGGIVRTRKLMLPRGYLARAQQQREFGQVETVAAEQVPFEFMLNALRLIEGVPLATFRAHTGLEPQRLEPALARARAAGWLDTDPTLLCATLLGQRFLNDVIASFLPCKTMATRTAPP
jgi:oxygen-independent coproporphyrinogen-3 oxidase